MRDALVTVFGGSGFLGRHTVRGLARAGYRVRIAARRPHTAHFLRPMGQVGQIDIVQANVKHEESVARALEGSTAALNLVGILYESRRQRFAEIHVEAAKRIARLAGEAGVDCLVHISAIGASTARKSRYARTKGLGEAAVREAFPTATILRPSILFGPEDAFFNRFAAMARLAPALPLIGGGKTRFQPVYVADVAAAIVKAVGDRSGDGRTYELGGPSIYTFRELMEYMLEVIDRRRLLVPIPFALAKVMGLFAGLFPGAPLTWDQVELLKTDNVVGASGDEAETLSALGVEPTALEAVVPLYLARFRRRGQFERRRLA